MAKLSAASRAPQRRSSRKDVYEVSVESEESQQEGVGSDDNASPSRQLLQESRSSPTPNGTPERPAQSPQTPSSKKSVRFGGDNIIEESVGLLANTAPRGNLKRSSSKTVPIIAKTQPVTRSRPSREDQVAVDKALSKNTAIRKGNHSAESNEAGQRRSGRSRQDLATYNDTSTVRTAAGLASIAYRKQAPETRPTNLPERKDAWTKEEEELLRQAREAGRSWEEIQQKILPHRTAGATQVYAAEHHIYLPTSKKAKNQEERKTPPRKSSRGDSTITDGRKRKTTEEEQTQVGSAKRRRVQERSAPSIEPQSDDIMEKEGTTDEVVGGKRADNVTAEARVHEMMEKNYNIADASEASDDGSEALQNERNDSALDLDDDPDAHLMPRLFGQFVHIRKVADAVIDLQARMDEFKERRPKTPLFQEFDSLRRKIRVSYKALIEPASEENAVEDRRIIVRSVTKLQRLVKGLDPGATASAKGTSLKDIYQFIFPDLIKILASATYTLVNGTDSDDDITSPDLLEVIRHTKCIVDLGSRASTWKIKFNNPNFALKKPIKNEIVAPLKKVLKRLERQHALMKKEEVETELLLCRNQELKRERTEKETEKKRLHELTLKKNRLRDLYIWRMSVESDLDRRIGKLAQPNIRQKTYPLDANGEPFERETIFKPRLSIPHMDRPNADDEDEDWTEAELEALQQGLAEIAHDRSFWVKFFKAYCYSHGPRRRDGSCGGPLRDRTVAEILKEMVKFRDYTIEEEAEEDVPEWLLDIPDADLIPLL